MLVMLNNRPVEVADDVTTLAQLLEREECAGPGQAVAVGETVVPRTRWGATPLKEGMKIIVIRAVCGG